MSRRARSESLLDDRIDPKSMAQGLVTLAEGLAPIAPPPGLWARIEESTQAAGRFARFATQVAQLLDIGVNDALDWLDRAADSAAYAAGLVPGMGLLNVRGGPAVSHAITGFVRLPSGTFFPEHKHLGQESVLVMQGRLQDASGTATPGDLITMPAGSSHAFSVPPGPDLLYLAVVQGGIQIGDLTLTPDDPRA